MFEMKTLLIPTKRVRKKPPPVTHANRPNVIEREKRLIERLNLVKAGYSKRGSISLELKEEINEKTLGGDLLELKRRSLIRVVSKEFWVPK